jgi:hypothetical protein
VFVMKGPDDSPKAVKHETVEQVFHQRPQQEAEEKRDHMAMLAQRSTDRQC